MTTLTQWAIKWGVSHAALVDLRQKLGMCDHAAPTDPGQGTSEAAVSARLRLEASRAGGVLWRNNVGALIDDRGVPVRYGLANDTAALNRSVKSADLIGIYPLAITADMVGTVVGQFWSVEAKEAGWRYTGRGREEAQARWAQAVIARGGRAGFST